MDTVISKTKQSYFFLVLVYSCVTQKILYSSSKRSSNITECRSHISFPRRSDMSDSYMQAVQPIKSVTVLFHTEYMLWLLLFYSMLNEPVFSCFHSCLLPIKKTVFLKCLCHCLSYKAEVNCGGASPLPHTWQSQNQPILSYTARMVSWCALNWDNLALFLLFVQEYWVGLISRFLTTPETPDTWRRTHLLNVRTVHSG